MASIIKVDTIKDTGSNDIITSDGAGNINITATGATVTGTLSATSFSGDGSALTGISSGGAFKNLIINGDMSIAQRGTSQASITSNGYYTVDRWYIGNSSLGTFTMSQDTDVPSGEGLAKSLKLDCTTADASPSSSDYLFLQTKFEGQNLQQLKKGTANAESLTLSFWVKSNKTGTYIAELFDTDNTRQISQSYTINSASTWEKKTLTYEGDTTGTLNNDNGESFRVFFYLGAGSAFTSGTLSTTWTSSTNTDRTVGQVNLADNTANEWYITGVQLEVGTSATPFEFLPYDVNLQRCQRYYEKSYDYGTTAGTATENGTSSLNGLSTSSKQIRSHDTRFTIEKRVNPTVTIYDKSGNSGKWTTYDSGGSGTDNVAYGGVITKNTKSFDIYSSGTTAAGYQFHYTVDAEL